MQIGFVGSIDWGGIVGFGGIDRGGFGIDFGDFGRHKSGRFALDFALDFDVDFYKNY